MLTKTDEESSQEIAISDRVYRHKIPKKLVTIANIKEILTFSQFQNWGNLGPYIVLSMTDDTGTNIPSLGECNCVKIRRMILNCCKDVVESKRFANSSTKCKGSSWVGKCLHGSLHWGSIERKHSAKAEARDNFCRNFGLRNGRPCLTSCVLVLCLPC